LDWINVYLHPQSVAGVNGTNWGHSWDDSVSTCATLLGVPRGWAQATQVLAALAALLICWQVFSIAHPQRLAILLCAVLLASPHVSNYDLLLLAIAALLLVRAIPEGCRPLAVLLPLAAWIAPLYNPPRAMALGLATPIVILGLIWVLFRQKAAQNPLSAKG
jgi:alpha-1,2-mannosyltransferase